MSDDKIACFISAFLAPFGFFFVGIMIYCVCAGKYLEFRDRRERAGEDQ